MRLGRSAVGQQLGVTIGDRHRTITLEHAEVRMPNVYRSDVRPLWGLSNCESTVPLMGRRSIDLDGAAFERASELAVHPCQPVHAVAAKDPIDRRGWQPNERSEPGWAPFESLT